MVQQIVWNEWNESREDLFPLEMSVTISYGMFLWWHKTETKKIHTDRKSGQRNSGCSEVKRYRWNLHFLWLSWLLII